MIKTEASANILLNEGVFKSSLLSKSPTKLWKLFSFIEDGSFLFVCFSPLVLSVTLTNYYFLYSISCLFFSWYPMHSANATLTLMGLTSNPDPSFNLKNCSLRYPQGTAKRNVWYAHPALLGYLLTLASLFILPYFIFHVLLPESFLVHPFDSIPLPTTIQVGQFQLQLSTVNTAKRFVMET